MAERCSCGVTWNPFAPRHKRQVRQLLEGTATDTAGLKGVLVWRARSRPHRLPKMAKYLCARIRRAVSRGDVARVERGIEVFDAIMAACRESLGLFVEHFFRVVALLLGSRGTAFPLLGAAALVRLADTGEHSMALANSQRWDYFVDKFVSMCWKTSSNTAEVRTAGLRGLRAVLRKKGEQRVKLWHVAHLDAMIFAFLHNVGASAPGDLTVQCLQDNVGAAANDLAVQCLQDALSTSSLGNLQLVLQSVHRYLTANECWVGNRQFAADCQRLVLSAVQPSLAHVVVSELLAYLTSTAAALPLPTQTGMIQQLELLIGNATNALSGSTLVATAFEVADTLLALGEGDGESRAAIGDCFARLAAAVPPPAAVELLMHTLGGYAEAPAASPRHQLCALRVAQRLEGCMPSSSVLDPALLGPVLSDVRRDEDGGKRGATLQLLTALLRAAMPAEGGGQATLPPIVRSVLRTLTACVVDRPDMRDDLREVCSALGALAMRYGRRCALATAGAAIQLDAVSGEKATSLETAHAATAVAAVALRDAAEALGCSELAEYVEGRLGPHGEAVAEACFLAGRPDRFHDVLLLPFGRPADAPFPAPWPAAQLFSEPQVRDMLLGSSCLGLEGAKAILGQRFVAAGRASSFSPMRSRAASQSTPLEPPWRAGGEAVGEGQAAHPWQRAAVLAVADGDAALPGAVSPEQLAAILATPLPPGGAPMVEAWSRSLVYL